MRKRLLAIIATAAMVVTMIPAMAFADVADTDVAEIDGVGYATLKEAIADAKDGDTITIRKECNELMMLKIGSYNSSKNITIDLNGYDIVNNNGSVIQIQWNSNLVIKGEGEIHTSADTAAIIVTKGSALTLEDNVYITGDKIGIQNKGQLKIDEAEISGVDYGIKNEGSITMEGGSVSGNYGITSYDDTEVTINGGDVSGDEYGIAAYSNVKVTVNDGTIFGGTAGLSGHGEESGTVFNITGGTIESEDGVGIYHPQNGELNISGGTITGATGINMKSGELSITDGEIIGTGEAKDYGFVGGGFNPTGDALVIESCGYPGGAPTASITGGTFSSDNADAVASYTGNNVTNKVDGFITDGEFNTDVSEYLPKGYAALIEHYAGSNDFNDMKCWIVEGGDEAAIEAGAVAKIITDGVTRYYLYFGEAEEAAGENVAVVRMAYEISLYAIDPNGREDLSKSSYFAIPNTYANINDYLKATGEEIQEPDPVEGYKFVGWYVADDYEWLEEDGSEMYDFVKNLKYSNVKLDLSAELDEDAQYFAKWEKVDAAAGTTDASKPADAVDTGDDSNMAIPFAVAGIALAAMAAVVATRRRHS